MDIEAALSLFVILFLVGLPVYLFVKGFVKGYAPREHAIAPPPKTQLPLAKLLEAFPSTRLKCACAKLALTSYGKIIEENPFPHPKPESLLPYSKSDIRGCIEFLLSEPLDATYRGILECSNVTLDSFIPDEEFNKIRKWGDFMSQLPQHVGDGEDGIQRLMEGTVEASGNEETILLREQIGVRIHMESQAALERHRLLRQVASEKGEVDELADLEALKSMTHLIQTVNRG